MPPYPHLWVVVLMVKLYVQTLSWTQIVVAYIIRCCWLITASVSSVTYWWNWGNYTKTYNKPTDPEASNQSTTSDNISHHNLSAAQSLYIKFHHQNHHPEVRTRWYMRLMQCIIMRGQDEDKLTFTNRCWLW